MSVYISRAFALRFRSVRTCSDSKHKCIKGSPSFRLAWLTHGIPQNHQTMQPSDNTSLVLLVMRSMHSLIWLMYEMDSFRRSQSQTVSTWHLPRILGASNRKGLRKLCGCHGLPLVYRTWAAYARSIRRGCAEMGPITLVWGTRGASTASKWASPRPLGYQRYCRHLPSMLC